MNEELNEINNNNNNIDESEDNINSVDDCNRGMDSNKTIESIANRFIDNNLNSFSSKSSIKSNSSHNSVKSHKSNKSTDSLTQTRIRSNILHIKDTFCWDCHKTGVDFSCKACLRSYHKKCPSLKKSMSESGNDQRLCPECIDIMRAEEGTNPSGCMQWLDGNVNQLSELLKYTIVTVRTADKNSSFCKPVSPKDYPEYEKLIVNPMDLSLVESNVKNKTYASTNSFLADIKWIHHNCIIFNSGCNNAFISEARNIVRVAKQECDEIEICPDCYYNYYTLEEDTYFAAVCRKPHAIVWAKLKGHPYWPAKVVRYDNQRSEVDIRFFGTHDKCWLRPEKCYLMSQNYPYNKKPSKFDQNKFDEAIRDMNSHLDELDKRHKGVFKFHEKHTLFTVDKLYLTQSSTQTVSNNFETISDDIKDKKVLNTYNGIEYKKLKVNASKFDIQHIMERIDSSEPKSPPNKRFKRSPLNGSPKGKTNRCISKSIPIRHELSSSVDSNMESEPSVNDLNNDSEIELSISSNVFDRNSNINGFDENNSQFDSFDEMKSNKTNDRRAYIQDIRALAGWSPANSTCTNESKSKFNPLLPKSKTFTVSGKSSEILNIDKSVEMNHKSNNSFNDSKSNSSKVSKKNSLSPKSKTKVIPKVKNESNNDLKSKIKTLEFKLRKLEEERNESNIKVSALEEEKEELRKANEDLRSNISEIKRKQWCTNCQKEAILPCCWNTCYCTVECQHKHWPIHSKACRRRTQTNRS